MSSNNATLKFNRRKKRVRYSLKKKSNGRPRLVVSRSNNHIYAQIIDDTKGISLLSVSTLDKSLSLSKTSNIEAAKTIGSNIASKAIENNIDSVYFDRGGYIYHGKIKALADSAREVGLKF